MLLRFTVRTLWAIAICLIGHSAAIAADEPSPSVSIFDTGVSSAAAISGQAVAKATGRTKLPDGQTAHEFKGDAVLSNGRITLVLRQGAPHTRFRDLLVRRFPDLRDRF